jgi:hypothetical protein
VSYTDILITQHKDRIKMISGNREVTLLEASMLKSSLLDCKFNLDWTGLDWKIDWAAVSVYASL